MRWNYTDAMIDIETLDTRPSAVVIAIGVVLFNRREPSIKMKGLHLVFGKKEFRDEQIMMGRTVDKKTVIWWKGQEPAAKKIFKQANVKSMTDMFEKLTAFLTQGDVKYLIWGNGASFDNTIVTSLYDSFGLEAPWKFWNDRCFRTFKGEHGHIARPPEFQGVKHNAEDDARQQARYLQAIYQELQKYNIQSYKDRQS
ncbi:3'-5' exonuclease [Marinobacter sp. DS40M6]|uniref:3'-5' exonuclease n=1 Tax=Marinobacter sp. DS40M6 TaxID=1597776 RepID=UPI002359BB3B|nr:3'-5' exonuclease [Marinobacter sp. DS40M6]MDC8457840.1 3'-5' exoribonuclease [Marinobacter sp. DS40M6]